MHIDLLSAKTHINTPQFVGNSRWSARARPWYWNTFTKTFTQQKTLNQTSILQNHKRMTKKLHCVLSVAHTGAKIHKAFSIYIYIYINDASLRLLSPSSRTRLNAPLTFEKTECLWKHPKRHIYEFFWKAFWFNFFNKFMWLCALPFTQNTK